MPHVYMLQLVLPAEKEVMNQPERPKAVQIQVCVFLCHIATISA